MLLLQKYELAARLLLQDQTEEEMLGDVQMLTMKMG